MFSVRLPTGETGPRIFCKSEQLNSFRISDVGSIKNIINNEDGNIHLYSPSLKFTIFIIYYTLSALTMLILAVCRMRATYECNKRPSSPRVFHSSVVRAPNWYLGGHGFDSRQGLRLSLCLMLVTNEHSSLSFIHQA